MKILLVLLVSAAAVAVEPPSCIPQNLLCEFRHENHPAKDCFEKMSSRIQESVKADCERYRATDDFGAFTQNIMAICNVKGYPVKETNKICDLSLTTPPFDLMFCEFDENNPLDDCYRQMSPQIQKSVKADCLFAGSQGGAQLEDFRNNIELICETKKSMVKPLDLTTPMPPLFDFCDFDSDYHPKHECYEMMSSQIQNSLLSDCIAAMGTDDFDKLGKNIELICETKKSMVKPLDLTTPMPPLFDFCDFDSDYHPKHDCYEAMSSQIQKSVVADCKAYLNTDKMDKFTANMMLVCAAKGKPIMLTDS